MQKLNAAPDHRYVPVMSNCDYPESEATYRSSGPGWSWMWVPHPFNSQWVQGEFNSYVFKRHQTSRDDLRAFIGEMLLDDTDPTDRRWSQAAVAALRDVTTPEFVLVCSTHWAFASFEVRSSTIPEAGTAFYNKWVGSMSFDEETQWALKLSEEPVVLRP